MLTALEMVFRIESPRTWKRNEPAQNEASYGRTGDIEVERLSVFTDRRAHIIFYPAIPALFPRFDVGKIPLRETFNI